MFMDGWFVHGSHAGRRVSGRILDKSEMSTECKHVLKESVANDNVKIEKIAKVESVKEVKLRGEQRQTAGPFTSGTSFPMWFARQEATARQTT